MHLDPDFETLTYGDFGHRRGAGASKLEENDFIVFYAGLRPTRKTREKLNYSIIGFFIVDQVVKAKDVIDARWGENAHTRRIIQHPEEIVVRAKRGKSGRLNRCTSNAVQYHLISHYLRSSWNGGKIKTQN
jgi:hypothetical protein